MRLAAVQFRARKEDLGSSRAALVQLTRQAAADADLVVLPEMGVSGYVFPDRASVRAVSETPDGPTFAALSAVAAEHRCWVVAGFAERSGEKLYNSALVLDAQGNRVGVYRKTLLYTEDLRWAEPGDRGYLGLDTPFGRLGVGICMDINDDRFVAWCARERLDVIAFPTNWVDESLSVWPYWQQRLAGQAGVLVAANTWGREAHVQFSGQSAILDARGLWASGPVIGDGVVRAVVDRR